MKKNFMKKLATTVALALTVTTIVPGNAGTAQAAGTQSLSANKVTLYQKSGYDFNVKNSSSAYAYTYTSADTGVATVNSKTGLVSAKSNGASKISCKIVNKKTKKTLKTLTATVTVVDKMALNTKSIALNEQETFDINMNKGITSSYSYRYTTSDAAVATVTSTTGVVTGVKEGTATIKVTVTNKSTKKSNVLSVPVAVKPGKLAIAVKQTHANKITLALSGPEAVTAIAKEDIIIKDSVGVPNYVSEAKLSADKKSVEVTTYSNFVNDTKYTVTYKEAASDFTAKLGEAAKIILENQTVQAGTSTKIKITVMDANGINLTSDDELKKISVSTDDNQGYLNDDGATKEITLYGIGDKATVSAKYNTGKFSDAGVETVLDSNKVVINAVEKLSGVVKFDAHTVVRGNAKADWDKLNKTVPLESTDYKLKVRALDADGKVIDETPLFETKDSNVLTVDDEGTLYPQKTGTGYVKVTIKDVTQVLAVTIGSKARLAALTVDKTNVTVSTVGDDVQTAKATAKDQYGNILNASDGITWSADNSSYANAEVTHNDGVVYISPKSKGTATVKVNVDLNGTKLTRPITVKTVEPSNAKVTTYKPVFSTNNIDLANGNNVLVRVEGLNSAGVKVKNLDIKKIELKAPNGQLYQIDATSPAAIGVKPVTGSALITTNLETEDGAKNNTIVFGKAGSSEQSPMLGSYVVSLIVDDDNDKDDSKTKTVKATVSVKNSDAVTPSVAIDKSGTESFDLLDATAKNIGERFFNTKIDGNEVETALNDYVIEGLDKDEEMKANTEYSIKVKSLSLDKDNVIFAYSRTLKIKINK